MLWCSHSCRHYITAWFRSSISSYRPGITCMPQVYSAWFRLILCGRNTAITDSISECACTGWLCINVHDLITLYIAMTEPPDFPICNGANDCPHSLHPRHWHCLECNLDLHYNWDLVCYSIQISCDCKWHISPYYMLGNVREMTYHMRRHSVGHGTTLLLRGYSKVIVCWWGNRFDRHNKHIWFSAFTWSNQAESSRKTNALARHHWWGYGVSNAWQHSLWLSMLIPEYCCRSSCSVCFECW